MEMRSERLEHSGKLRYSFDIDSIDFNQHMAPEIFRQIAVRIAERFVSDHFGEIAKMLDPQAIANLSIAEGAAAIRETLEKKMPDKILNCETERTVHKTEVWQRGIFGGLKRIR